MARSARKESNLKIRQPLAALIVVPGNDAERQCVTLFEDHFLEELNVKSVSIRDDRDGLYTVTVAPNMKTLGPKFGRHLNDAKKAILALDGRVIDARLTRGESVTLAVPGADAAITLEDIIVTKNYGDDWAGASDGGTIVLIDKRVTTELKNEGLARDIIRNVQKLRKDTGLDIADRIRLNLETDSQTLRSAIDQFRDYVAGETLATEITNVPSSRAPRCHDLLDIDVERHKLTIALIRV